MKERERDGSSGGTEGRVLLTVGRFHQDVVFLWALLWQMYIKNYVQNYGKWTAVHNSKNQLFMQNKQMQQFIEAEFG